MATPLTVPAFKLAAHVGLSYEALVDFDVFSKLRVRIELQRQVIQTENAQFLYGTGAPGPPESAPHPGRRSTTRPRTDPA